MTGVRKLKRPELLSEERIAELYPHMFRPAIMSPCMHLQFTAHVPPLCYQTSKRRRPRNVLLYQQALAGYAMQAKCDFERDCRRQWPMHGIYMLAVRAYFVDRRVRDFDNAVQPVANAIKGVLYVDDWQVQLGTTAKLYDPENPRVTVLLECIQEAAEDG